MIPRLVRSKIALSAGLSAAAIFAACSGAPDLIKDGQLVGTAALASDGVVPGVAGLDIFKPGPSRREYRIDAGKKIEVRESSPLDEASRWTVSITEVRSPGAKPVPASTLLLSRDGERVLMHHITDHLEGRTTVFFPPIVLGPSRLEQGRVEASTSDVEIRKGGVDGGVVERGRGTHEIALRGVVDPLRPDVLRVDSVLTFQLSAARVVRDLEISYEPALGIVGEVERRVVRVKGIPFSRKNRSVQLLSGE